MAYSVIGSLRSRTRFQTQVGNPGRAWISSVSGSAGSPGFLTGLSAPMYTPIITNAASTRKNNEIVSSVKMLAIITVTMGTRINPKEVPGPILCSRTKRYSKNTPTVTPTTISCSGTADYKLVLRTNKIRLCSILFHNHPIAAATPEYLRRVHLLRLCRRHNEGARRGRPGKIGVIVNAIP